MSKRDILLLGGDGFIGTALSAHLAANNYRVHVISRGLAVRRQSSGNIFRYRGDLTAAECLSDLLPTCETIVHLASATTPGTFAQDPSREVALNIQPTIAFLEILKDFREKHLIFISSGGTLYGNAATLPASEDTSLQPLSYHGAGKLAVETFLNAFAHLAGHSVTIVRPSNIYGPGQRYRSGFGVIRTMLEHLRKDTEMAIWGDGSVVRDFLFIDDMIRALALLVDHRRNHTLYNIGSGRGFSLNDIKAMIKQVCGRDLKTRHLSHRPIDVKGISLSPDRFAADTGWHPAVSLEEGLLKTWNWLTGPSHLF